MSLRPNILWKVLVFCFFGFLEVFLILSMELSQRVSKYCFLLVFSMILVFFGVFPMDSISGMDPRKVYWKSWILDLGSGSKISGMDPRKVYWKSWILDLGSMGQSDLYSDLSSDLSSDLRFCYLPMFAQNIHKALHIPVDLMKTCFFFWGGVPYIYIYIWSWISHSISSKITSRVSTPSPAGWQEDALEASVSGVQGASHPRSVTQQQ